MKFLAEVAACLALAFCVMVYGHTGAFGLELHELAEEVIQELSENP